MSRELEVTRVRCCCEKLIEAPAYAHRNHVHEQAHG